MCGIDVSPLAIEVCKERGLRQAALLALEDISGLAGSNFDSVLMLGNNLGLLGDEVKAKESLTALYTVTADHARIIGENIDFHQLQTPEHVSYREQNLEHGRMAGHVSMRVRHQDMEGEWFNYVFRSVEELRRTLGGTGWSVEQILGDTQYMAVLKKD